MRLLEGKPIAARIKENLKEQIQGLGFKPILASIQVGENAGAAAYARSQKKVAEGLGIEYKFNKLTQDAKERDEDRVAGIEQHRHGLKSFSIIAPHHRIGNPGGFEFKDLIRSFQGTGNQPNKGRQKDKSHNDHGRVLQNDRAISFTHPETHPLKAAWRPLSLNQTASFRLRRLVINPAAEKLEQGQRDHHRSHEQQPGHRRSKPHLIIQERFVIKLQIVKQR